MPALLSINNLEVVKRRSNQDPAVVQRINLTINEGETVGIAGESGSGKSVTALSVLNLLPAALKVNDGSIELNLPSGKIDLLAQPEKILSQIRGKEIGMIFQEPMTSLNPAMQCGRQVEEVIKLHDKVDDKNAKARVIALFEEVKLPDVKQAFHKYPHELSGGQRQRVMIAMAVACNPKLLIADEPTTALDVTVQKSILELLDRLKEKYKMSMLFISHDLGILASISDRIALMYQGEIVESGFSIQVLENPQHSYTKALLACRPDNKHYTEVPVLPTVSNETEEELKPEEKISFKNEHTNSGSILRVEHLNTSFIIKRNFFGKTSKEFFAVKDVSFEVFENETLGIVGGSGSGKTTLGRTILNLVKARDGKISYRGRDISNLSSNMEKEIRSKIQIIFQDPYSSLNPRIKIGESIREVMAVHHIYDTPEQRITETKNLLKIVGLSTDSFQKYPHEFSGGQRQRIGIARALAVKPELIICDEMVSALDVSVQAQVLNLLNRLKSEFGLTYLFISHDLAVVKYMADRLLVMNQGSIVERGDCETVMNNPQHPYTQSLIHSLTPL